MTKKNIILTLISALLGFLIAMQVVGVFLENPTIVQDDFRQTNFWFWQFWDSSLFQSDFFTENNKNLFYITPIYAWIWQVIMPIMFPTCLIYASKIYAIILSVLGAVASFFFFDKISKSKNSFLSLAFVLSMSVLFWCTDHVSAAHVRSSIWLLLLCYMYLKVSKKDLWAGLFCLPMLFYNPTAFILCMGMEGFSWLLGLKNKVFTSTFYLGLLNSVITILYHFVYLGGVKYAGAGHSLTAAEMKLTPEFNLGGRHPVFGSSLWDGSWWTNEHWGFGYGYLEISKLVFIALGMIVIYLLFVRPSMDTIKQYLVSVPALLVYSSVSLYVLSQLVFPLLYLPSRYISVSFILLSVVLIYLCLAGISEKIFSPEFSSEKENLTRAERRKLEKKKTSSKELKARKDYSWLIYIIAGLSFWLYFHNFYHPRYVSINPKISHLASALPKDVLIAGHPLLPDLNTLSIVSKRRVFVDHERSIAFTDKAIEEIRRRNRVVLDMTYAKSRDEFINLAKENGITHYLALYDFYHPAYLAKPRYVEPYNSYLQELVKLKEGESFYIADYLREHQTKYALLDISKL